MKSIEFTIITDKILSCTAQQKRVNHKTGVFFDSPKLRETRKFYENAFKDHKPEKMFDGAVEVEMKFYFSVKDKKKKGTWKTTRGDCDNLVKVPIDAMMKLGFFNDDAQIARLIVQKRYSENEPYIEVKIKELID